MQENNLYYYCLEKTPMGPVSLAVSELGMVALSFGPVIEEKKLQGRHLIVNNSHPLLMNAVAQLDSYFKGDLEQFNLLVDWRIFTDFEKKVLQEVMLIPFGQVRTYGEVAEGIGQKGASRAVGGANGRNPIPIIIPCHRVVSSSMKLHGYSASVGLDGKAFLLSLEGLQVNGQKIISNN